MDTLVIFWYAVVDWLSNGLWVGASGWTMVAFTLVMTHITIASVTIFLHRTQAHRALELGSVPSHFFRFWLWLTTGMVTREWVAVHRKHHAKCETTEDPHSPETKGIRAVLLRGSELYRAEAKNQETIAKYGHHTPDDWLERHLYTRHGVLGVSLMLVIDLLLFGAIGITVWAVQMLWIPVTAAGIVNGIGHFWGYRNFESSDASTNVSPWGIVIGGEELHNNHHTYPTAAKLSVKRYEFDIGWLYISILVAFGWAKVRKVPPQLELGTVKPVADSRTLEAIIANRYEVMARFARMVRAACVTEIERARGRGAQKTELRQLKLVQGWLARNGGRTLPPDAQERFDETMKRNPHITRLMVMREELCQLWTRTNVSVDRLVADLQAWCQKAESSGIESLQSFSRTLRSIR